MQYDMKNTGCLLIALGGLAFLTLSCSEDDLNQHSPIEKGGPKPANVTGVKVENKSGAAVITYQLPDDPNLQYVLAEYETNKVQREAKTSRYNDTLYVDGFHKEGEYDITLYTVSKSEVKSDPLNVKVHPTTPAYRNVAGTIQLMDDFGGVNVLFDNPEQAKIALVVVTKDANGDLIPVESFYTQNQTGNFSVRGYDTTPRTFGVYVKDRWNNYSDTLFQEITPMFETRLDKTKYRPYVLPLDQGPGWGWVMTNFWDNNLGTGFHTLQGGEPRPHRFTFDLGVTAKLSRFKLLQRTGDYLYMHGNPKEFVLYGSDVAPNPSGSWEGWTTLLHCHSIKPSGLPTGQNTEDDRLHAMGTDGLGEEFIFPLSAPPVRYIRMEIVKNWGNTDFFHAMEITFWGSPQ